MQTIKHNRKLIHPLLNDIEYFYTLTSEKSLKNDSMMSQSIFHESFKAIQDVFNKYSDTHYNFKYKKQLIQLIETPNSENKIVVCFSGGKDSLTTALYYKDKGYDVYLYHLRGINKCYPKEWEYAKQLAEKLNLPIYFDKVTLSGNHDWIEHPMKNMIIANLALSYAIEDIGTIQIAFGNYTTSYLDFDPFEVCSGDDVEMWNIYDNIIQQIIPDFKMNLVLTNIEDSMKCLVEHKELIPYVSSCIGTHRFTGYYRQQNIKNYNIDLPKSRCGSCWKCAYEYIYLCDNDVLEYNKAYYKHCLQVIQRTIKREQNRKVSLEEAFREYMFYDVNDSHLYKTLH